MNDMDKQQEVYRSLIGHNDLVFDIGANIGQRSAVFQNMCKRVIAVEPQKELFEIIKGRFFGSNVTCVHAAVGHASGTGKMYIPTDGSLGRHGVGTLSQEFMQVMGPKIFNLDNGWDKTEQVNITTLDNLITQYGRPGFIKLDIEGYELEAVMGLTQKVNALSFEFHPQLPDEYENVITQLVNLGFREFNYCLAEIFEWQMEYWSSYTDVLCHLDKFIGNEIIYGDCYAR
jgi:FkbM family methyltransferase